MPPGALIEGCIIDPFGPGGLGGITGKRGRGVVVLGNCPFPSMIDKTNILINQRNLQIQNFLTFQYFDLKLLLTGRRLLWQA